MGIENITARIMDEARTEAAQLLAQAEDEKEKLLSDTRAATDAAKKNRAEAAQIEARTLKEHRASLAQLEARKLVLAAKQETVDKCFDMAKGQIAAMPADKYKKFLLDILSPYMDEEGEVVLNAHDREIYGADIKEALKAGRLTLSDDTADISGGLFLKQGNVSINASIDSLTDARREEMTLEAVSMLFPAQ